MDNAWRKSFKMVIKRLKILPPTLRDKRRYVKIRIICEKEGCYKKFMEEFREITNTIVYGQFLIGVIQGLALGIGLFILQVPKSLILTFVAIVVSIIPILGSWLVWLPAGIFLITTGSVFKGIVLLIYGGLFVSSIDNILRPYFISKKSHMSIVIALIGVIGGLYAFGIVGLVIGPLILSYVMIIIDFYRQGKLNELFRE